MQIGIAGTGKMGTAIAQRLLEVGHEVTACNRTMLAEGERRGVELPLVAKSLACYEEAKRQVSGTAEISAVSVYWANRAGRQSAQT